MALLKGMGFLQDFSAEQSQARPSKLREKKKSVVLDYGRELKESTEKRMQILEQ